MPMLTKFHTDDPRSAASITFTARMSRPAMLVAMARVLLGIRRR